ncbi:ribosome biogenesis regulatory protein homolog [Clavelina lepadiformis]|uniref:ribosome biogenesis regulatory protein homolog n=1 Tax=Clavelina lepadiformis TaxID=159417 RepID=UPI00404316F7
MAVKAAAIIENLRNEEQEKLKSTFVEKGIDLDLDIGNLLASDSNPFDINSFRSGKDAFLKSLARDNAQVLFNEIWKLPVERIQDSVIAKLPSPETTLPREKPIPKLRPPTKWEEYAKLKGIKNRKKGRMVWDDASKSWKPRWGYQRAKDDTKEWVLEVPKNADPNEDQFAKKMKEKKEKVAKNELQRLRNIARRSGKKVPGVGATMTAGNGKNPTPTELESTFHLAKKSTASLGRFEGLLKNEKPQKNRGKKRKFQPLMTSEKDQQLKILGQMYKKAPQVNVEKAAKREIRQSQSGNVKAKKGGKKGGKSKVSKRKEKR